MRWRRWEHQMDSEMRFHLEELTADYIRQGFTRKEAELRARREFGPIELSKDECRDGRTLEWLRGLFRDVRYASRSLRKSPGFTLAAVLTLALGVGANAAIFSAVYAVLLKPLPYTHPDQIYSVEVVIPERRSQIASLPVALQAYLAWRKADTAFTDMTVLTPAAWNLTGDGDPERVDGARVATNFFSFLGVAPAHGRGFARDEEQPGKHRVVVISDALWRRRYGADPALIGKSISLNGEKHVVVGIAPTSLLVPTGAVLHPMLVFGPRVDIWMPIAPTRSSLQNESWDLGLLVRLKPGERLEEGRRQLDAVLNRVVHEQAPGIETILNTRFVPIREVYAGKVPTAAAAGVRSFCVASADCVHQHREPVSGASRQSQRRIRDADRPGSRARPHHVPDSSPMHI